MKFSLRGFSLVELLVGMAIGLLSLLAVAQVFVTFNQHRTTATQVLEAQGNGAMALYLLEKDIDQAGFGLMSIQGCGVIQWCKSSNPAGGGSCDLKTALSTQPLIITDGGTSSDTIDVQYAQSTSGSPGTTISQDQTAYTDAYSVVTIAGYAVGDIIVSDVNGKCTMAQVTNVDSANFKIEHAVITGAYHNSSSALSSDGWQAAKAKDQLVNLGSYASKNYSVSGSSLVLKTFPNSTSGNAVEGIVLMKAQYGLDTDSDGAVDEWRCGAPTCAAVTDATQIIAVRIGIIARSPLQEKDVVDSPTTLTVLPAITGGAAVTYDLLTLPNVNGVPATHFRYKTYYTIVPLRNVIWGK